MIDAKLVAEHLVTVRERLSAAGGDSVTIIGVTKGHGADAVAAAVDVGMTDIGESYAQELLEKFDTELAGRSERPRIHFIGGLQRNKVRRLAGIVDVWQSVDRVKLGEEIARRAPGASVMVQVDLSHESSKGGCSADETPELVARLKDLGLDVLGLMGIGPMAEPQAARPGFALLRGLVDELGLAECSMGMSADLEVAVEEGSTMVRVGTDLFGARPRLR